MLLADLPLELLSMIASYLPGCAVECLAQTYNKPLTNLCLALPVVRHRVQERKNATRMCHLFSPHEAFKNILNKSVSKKAFHDFGFNAFGAYTRSVDRPCLDYLDLRGDLKWMEDIPEAGDDGRSVELNVKLDTVERHAALLGLRLPQAFLAMMRNGRRREIPSLTVCDPDLGDLLNITTEEGTGYIIKFCIKEQNALFWYLYLDAQGGHCVLLGGFDVQENDYDEALAVSSDPLEAKLDIRVLGNEDSASLSLQGTSFESWLAETYMRLWAVYDIQCLPAGGTKTWKYLPEMLVEYVVGMYTEEGQQCLSRCLAPSLRGSTAAAPPRQ